MFYVKLKKAVKGWRNKKPYLVIATDIEKISNLIMPESHDVDEMNKVRGNISLMDEDDEEELEAQEEKKMKEAVEKAGKSQSVIVWLLISNSITGRYKWVELNDTKFIGEKDDRK